MSDNFGATLDDNTGGGFRKTQYLAMKPGTYTIRILDGQETKKYAHFIGRGYIECLGEECPICQNNKKILYEHPEDYKDVQGWCPKRPRFFLNVLDRADGQVKVLSSGPQLIDDIKTQSVSIRNEQDERIDIRHYDWVLTVRGEGRDKETTPSHKYYGKETAEQVDPEALYDLENCLIKLSAEEMLDVFNGASLKDVFAVRKAKKQADEMEFSSDAEKAIEDSANELFSQ